MAHGKSTNAAARRALRLEIEDFNVAYGRAIDDDEIEAWPDFFSADALYEVISRENHKAGLPSAILICEGRGMFIDRITAIRKTMVYAPRQMRHFIGNAAVIEMSGESITARANFMVVESQRTQDTGLSLTGEYHDRFVRDADGALRLRERRCIFDSMKLRAAVVYPI